MTSRIPHISRSEEGGVRPILFSIKDAAHILGVSPWSIRRLLDEKVIAESWIGQRRLVVRESLESYAARVIEESA